MLFEKTKLPGAYLITHNPMRDERGFFVRSFCKKEFDKLNLHSTFVQCNISYNHKQGTLRGIHYQIPPHSEVKIVSCLRGAIYDVIVDLREESPTYGQWFGTELSEKNYRSLYIPQGFAHGFQTLCDNTELFYYMGNYYVPEAAKGIRFDDPILGIAWPISDKIISSRDLSFTGFTL